MKIGGRFAIAATVVALVCALAPSADASYRARANRGGFVTEQSWVDWFVGLFSSDGEEGDAGMRIDANG